MGDDILTKTTFVFPEIAMVFNVLTWCLLEPPGPALPSRALSTTLFCSSPGAEEADCKKTVVFSQSSGAGFSAEQPFL